MDDVRSRHSSSATAGESFARNVGLLCVGTLLLTMAFLLDRAGYDVIVGGIVALVIGLVGYPALRSFARRISEPHLFALLYWALIAKLFTSIGRYLMVYVVYDGVGDSAVYDENGWLFAQEVRKGLIFPDIPLPEGSAGQIARLTGYLYAITGRSIFGGFFIYSLFAYCGMLLFARGVQHGVPEIDTRQLYRVVLFFPSLLFWPSAIGKDAVMMLLLGVSMFGAGKLLGPTAHPAGLIPFGLGLGGMLLIRPHVGLMSVVALTVAIGIALITQTRSEAKSGRARFVRGLALIVVLMSSVVAAQSVTLLFSEHAGEATSTSDALALTEKRTSVGESKFKPVAVTSPASFPTAFVSTFFRPFPWEVRNGPTAIAGLESLILASLLAISLPRFRSSGRLLWRRPIFVFSAAYILMFVVAFSYIGNVGILARQRTQALPFVLMFAALPLRRRAESSSDGITGNLASHTTFPAKVSPP